MNLHFTHWLDAIDFQDQIRKSIQQPDERAENEIKLSVLPQLPLEMAVVEMIGN